jgi:hypothetical protein
MLPKYQPHASDIRTIRCPFCGYESRAAVSWIRSQMQYAGCGEKFSLHESKIRKVFDAIRRRLGQTTR